VGEKMSKVKKCKKCGIEMYQDDRGEWFCPDCVIEEIEPDFLDEKQISRGELKRPYVLEPPTKQVSLRVPLVDLELARRLARRKGIPKYQTYIKTLLHEMLLKEAENER
jgi:predicted DNA binding CopG/RHH family protein